MRTSKTSHDAVSAYLRSIGRIPLLTHEEEVILAQRVQSLVELEGKKEELTESLGQAPTWEQWAAAVSLTPKELQKQVKQGERAQEQMVKANLRLVVSIAKKYSKSNLEMLDLIQEGSMGLQRGVRKFDPKKGFRFSTYAYWWIRQAMTRAIAEQSRTIRLPIHINEKLTKIKKVQREFFQTQGRSATVQELSNALDLEPEKIRHYLNQSRQLLSLDRRVGEDNDTELSDLLEDEGPLPEDFATHSSLQGDLQQLLKRLNRQQQRVLILRYGLQDANPLTLAKIGQMLKISRERVRQIEKESLQLLKQYQGDMVEYLVG